MNPQKLKHASDEKFNEIIPTAILTAYPRTLSDIPYSKEIFAELLKAYEKIDDDLIVNHLAVELEARSKIIDKLILETDSSQILELAAGFSSRGLIFADKPNTQYLELDLPDLIDIKLKILNEIKPIPKNLSLIKGNALCSKDYDNATNLFKKNKPVTIVNEGLLRYLTFEEKAQAAKNVKKILEQFGGTWISGDGSTKKFRHNQNRNLPKLNANLLKTTKRNTLNNTFNSQAHFREFFNDLGFTTEFHNYSQIQDELTSPEVLNLNSQQIAERLQDVSAVVFRLK